MTGIKLSVLFFLRWAASQMSPQFFQLLATVLARSSGISQPCIVPRLAKDLGRQIEDTSSPLPAFKLSSPLPCSHESVPEVFPLTREISKTGASSWSCCVGWSVFSGKNHLTQISPDHERTCPPIFTCFWLLSKALQRLFVCLRFYNCYYDLLHISTFTIWFFGFNTYNFYF